MAEAEIIRMKVVDDRVLFNGIVWSGVVDDIMDNVDLKVYHATILLDVGVAHCEGYLVRTVDGLSLFTMTANGVMDGILIDVPSPDVTRWPPKTR